MEIDSQTRLSYLTYEKQGPSSLPKHKMEFVQRERQIKEFYEMFSDDIINELEFIDKISSLFISERFHEHIDKINISNECDDNDIDEDIHDQVTAAAKVIFVNEFTSKFYKMLNKQ